MNHSEICMLAGKGCGNTALNSDTETSSVTQTFPMIRKYYQKISDKRV